MTWVVINVAACLLLTVGLFVITRPPRVAEAVDISTKVWWPYGERSRRAFMRGGSVAILPCGLMAAGLISAGATPAQNQGARFVLTNTLFALMGIGFLLTFTVSLFGWPRALVPASLRDLRNGSMASDVAPK